MPRELEVRVNGPDGAARLAATLRDPSSVLTSIGAALVAQSRQAFEDQRLGDILWPERYPKQKPPFLNIAPVVQKAGEGRTPTADDFRNRPALGGVGSELAQSVSFHVDGNVVEVGSARADLKPELFHYGGIGRIPITETTKKTLGEWLKTKTGKDSKAKVPGSPGTTRSDYAPKLAFVFKEGRTELVQSTYSRPFVGFGDTTMAEVEDEIAVWLGAA